MKNSQLNVRLSAELRAEVEEACRLTGLDPAIVVRECLKAFVSEVQSTGAITLPLAVVPRRVADDGRPAVTPTARTMRLLKGARVPDAVPTMAPTVAGGVNEEPEKYRVKKKPKKPKPE